MTTLRLDGVIARRYRGICIAALHKKCCPTGQNSGKVTEVDACDGFLPFPSHQLFPSGGFNLHTSKAAVSTGGLFFACYFAGGSKNRHSRMVLKAFTGQRLVVFFAQRLRSSVRA